ncbi:MAG TPA: DUF58 domain-containing protein [Porticoccaceae bacterium]|nr:DUF58 domain-containing protein [Porticoccaceae bacterium]
MAAADHQSPGLPASVATSAGSLVQLRYAARELSLFPRKPPRAQIAGGYQSRFRGRGMDFDEVRPYQPGDDRRSIDWRVTARTQQPHTKVYREERERPVILVVDLRQSMFFGSRKCKSVSACEVAAALAWAGLSAGDRVGGLIFSPTHEQDIRARNSHHSVLQIIKSLAETSAALVSRQPDQHTLANIFEHARRVAHPGSTLVVISDFHDFNRDCESQLFELGRHCDLTLCRISDALDRELPPAGLYPVNDGHDRFTLDARKPEQRKVYHLKYQQQTAYLEKSATALGAGYLNIHNDQNPIHTLAQVYGTRNRKRRRQ